MTWSPVADNPRALHCSECEIDFPIGRDCGCPPGYDPASDVDEDASPPALGTDIEMLPTVADYERMIFALYFAQRRQRDLMRRLDMAANEWRVSQLVLSQAVAISNHLDRERKTLVSCLEAARNRELPEEVARLERLDKARKAGTRSRRAHGVDSGN